jgi:hypothetical protein
MMATGERRARLGDLAAGTMIVSTDGAPAEVAPAAVGAAPEAEDELEPDDEEAAEVEDQVVGTGYVPITGVAAVEEAEPVVDSPPALDHTLDLATPSLKELAQDVAAATGSERAAEPAPEPVVEPAPEPVVEVAPEPVVEPQPRPLAEVEIGGPEIDVDHPQVNIRSVETVSAIDLVMGPDDPSEDRPAADEPPAGA